MKRSNYFKVIIGVLIVLLFGNQNVFAASCNDETADALLNHFNIKSSYNFDTKQVTLKVSNGSFIVTHFESDGTVLDSDMPVKKNGDYEGAEYKYYSFGSQYIVKNGSPIKFRTKAGGTIKIGLSFFKENNKSKKDSSTDCYSYDYWKKYHNKKNIKTFQTKYDNNGKTYYIEIDVPNPAGVDLKDNTNKNTYCKAITEGHNYKGVYDKELLSHWSNSIEATNFYKNIIGDCWNDKVLYVYSEEEIKSLIESALNLWYMNSISYDTGSGKDEVWSINFDKVRDAAKASGNAYYAEDNNKGANLFKLGSDGYSKGASVSNEFSLKCNFKGNNLNLYKGDGSYNIDANVNNFYAINVIDQSVKYTYNYTGNASFKNKVTENVNVCRTTCEEAVEVKYGPPVASKAGLCFEYQVQVTSRVKCKADINPNAKPKIGNYCSPVPYCNRVPGYTHQGGPNDEYDKCINDCDGGKYTKSCSDKCYNEVYNSSNKTSNYGSEMITADKIATGNEKIFKVDNGVYVRNKNNVIYWQKELKNDNGKTIGYTDAKGYARYYLEGSERSRTIRDHGAYKYDSYGFKRAVYGDTLCNDACSFSGCSRHTYLNPGEMEKDYKDNIKLYKNSLAQCKLSASCTEKKAVFNIKASYSTKENDGNIKNHDTTYGGVDLTSSTNTQGTCPTTPDDGSIILNYQGCYKECGNQQQYHTRWSFPGTWFNIKTGEISYKPKTDSAWYKEKEKFCSPLNALNINEAWWNYYLHNNPDMVSKLSIDPDKYSSQCATGNGTIKSPLSIDKIERIMKDDNNREYKKWNIEASTEKFGYFGWNFNIKCFYALNDCKTNYSSNNYSIRKVDTADMFPSSDGTKLTDSSTTGRTPNYNWSAGAVTNKNPNFVIDPPKYITKVQSAASSGKNNIYVDDNIDYLFDLSSKDIVELRKGKNFTDYTEGIYMKPGNGGDDANNGVSRYYSNIISKYAKVRPNKKAVQCNNIKNISSGTCDDYND